jgi:hypothetical protein
MRTSLRKLAKCLHAALFSSLMLLLVGGVGGPLLIFSDSRSGESEGSTPPSERQEEFTALGRFDHERQMKLEQRRSAIIFEAPSSSHLGHTQNVVFLAPNGHRLANGLLAPLTC